MLKLSSEINAGYVEEVLTSDVAIDKLLNILEAKGKEMAAQISSMEELEGESVVKGNLRILKQCPMAEVIAEVKAHNNNALPPHYDEIVAAFKNKYPNRGAILHPLCIIHQVIRTTFGMEHGEYYEEVACRGGDGTIVVSQDGLVMSGLTDEEAKQTVSGSACLYYIG